MKEKWTEYDRKLEENIRLNRQLISAIHLKEGRSRLRRLLGFTAIHALLWFGCVAALGNFIYEHLAVPRFALPAAALDLYAIGFLIALIRQMILVSRIEYGQPITAIQRQLEAVRLLRIRTTQWAVLAGTVVWAPFLIVMSKAFFGLDMFRVFGAPWVTANLLFGLALIPLAIWTSRKFGDRFTRSPFIQKFMRDLAGNNLNAAITFLASLSEFANENGQ
ncbi:MAG: hypothetical protein M3Y72_02310 [Acidobacteriota bacterium]|nr:hypothetical protein [Acidobacteriota bacterium]